MNAEATFNSLVGDLDYPMFLVTACAGFHRAKRIDAGHPA